MEEDWKIASGRKECHGCGRQFAEGEGLYSVLYETEDELKRADFCTECWRGSDEGAFSFWRTRVPVKNEPNSLPPGEALLELFRRLGESSYPRKEQFRYVLALLLLRKRLLKLIRTERKDDQEVFVLEDRKTGEDVPVTVPRLTDTEVKVVSEELGKLLNARVDSGKDPRSETDEDRRACVQGSGRDVGSSGGEVSLPHSGGPQDKHPA